MRGLDKYLPATLRDALKLDDRIVGYVVARSAHNPAGGHDEPWSPKEYARVTDDGAVVWVGDRNGATLIPAHGSIVAACVAHFLGRGAVEMAVEASGAADLGDRPAERPAARPAPTEGADLPF